MMKVTASRILKIANKQIGICESPANSNRQKYGKAYGWNGTYWCAQFVWWCGWKAAKKVEEDNPIGKSASAAYIQEETVKKGGKWVMRKTKSKAVRKAYCGKAKPGDVVSFDFGAYDAIRDHVGIVDHVDGSYIYCIEGNTSKSGSQSNGGMVCKQRRHYSQICSAVRPKYAPEVDKSKIIEDKARELAWPKGTPKSKYKYPEGRATKAFRQAIEKVYPHRDSWGVQPRKGASCDVAVGTTIRASGVDKNFPRGLDEQIPHLRKSKKWKRVSRRKSKPGYVIVQIYNSGAGHIMIDMGKNVVNAHYIKKTYMVIESKDKILKSANECRLYRVYKPR